MANHKKLTEEHKRKIGETNSRIILKKVAERKFTSPMLGRTHSFETRIKLSKAHSKLRIDIDKERLYELYTNQLKTAKEVAETLGCSEGCIVKRLRIYGIHQRTKSEAKIGKLNPRYDTPPHNKGKSSLTYEPQRVCSEKQAQTIRRLYRLGLKVHHSKGKTYTELYGDRANNIKSKLSNSHKLYIQLHPEEKKRLKKFRDKQVFPINDTSIEVKVQNYLKELGFGFFTHQYRNEIQHSYQCDILIPSLNLVIECDGDYWHHYPIGKDLDHIRTSELIEKGFKVLRLWEHEIKSMTLQEFEGRLNGKIILGVEA